MTTNCVLPPELDDKQLLAYLEDSSANPETARHLELCPHCRARAEALGRLQQNLTTRLYRITCPTPMELGEYHLRDLPASRRLLIAQHLRECPLCTQEITQLEDFLGEFTPQTNILSTAKVLVAKLVGGGTEPGSFQTTPALRGESKNLPIFEADGIVISLDVRPGPHAEISIMGQMAADDQDQWTGATVELKQTYLAPMQATLDDLGAFQFNSVDPGSTQMTITSPDGKIIETETVFIST